MHSANSFVTLTYDDEHLPEHGALRYSDFQDLVRSLRQRGRHERLRFRYLCAGEYGPETLRPHYHALLFGYRPTDLRLLRRNKHDDAIYSSAHLEAAWGKGFVEVGDVTPASAGYCSQYALKKVNGEHAELAYQRLDINTGEMIQVPPEFVRMSLKPGIGLSWYLKYHQELDTHDAAHVHETKNKIPKYYDGKTKDLRPEVYETAQYKRYLQSVTDQVLDNQTPERLSARETVAKAKASLNSRDSI